MFQKNCEVAAQASVLLSAEAINTVDPVEWQAEPSVFWSFGFDFPGSFSQAEDAEQIRAWEEGTNLMSTMMPGEALGGDKIMDE